MSVPGPRSVVILLASASPSTLRLMAAMWKSSVLVDPTQFSSHTSLMSVSRETTRPASAMRRESRSNSLARRGSSSPPSQARRAPVSMVRSWAAGVLAGAALVLRRRSWARIRASSSASLKGLVT